MPPTPHQYARLFARRRIPMLNCNEMRRPPMPRGPRDCKRLGGMTDLTPHSGELGCRFPVGVPF